MWKRVLSIVAIAGLAACGGGKGGSPVLPASSSTPVAAPTSASGAGSNGTGSSSATTVVARIAISQAVQQAGRRLAQRAITAKKRPADVSASTEGITVSWVPSGNGNATPTTQVFDVSPGSANCTSNPDDPRDEDLCTLTLNVGVGSWTFTMTLYDEAPSGNSIPQGANVLGIGTLTQAIVANQNNTLDFIVDGVVSPDDAAFFSEPSDGNTHVATIISSEYDADGNLITGTYANSLTVALQEQGGSGHTSFILDGNNVGSSATVNSSNDTLQIQYDGKGSSGYTTLSHVTYGSYGSATVQMSPLYVTGSYDFTAPSQNQSITATEADSPYTQAFGVTWSCSGFTITKSGTEASSTIQLASAAMTAGSVVTPYQNCSPSFGVKDIFGTTVSAPFTGSLPTTSECSTQVSNTYLGVQSGSNYVLSNGSVCPLTVSASTVQVYAGPGNNATYPQSTSFTVSEANDATTPTITGTSACSPQIGVSPSLTAGSGYTGSAGGSIGVTGQQAIDDAQCTVTVNDGNGQTKNVTLYIDPYPSNVTSSGSFSWTDTCSDNGEVETCSGQQGNALGVSFTASASYPILVVSLPSMSITGNSGGAEGYYQEGCIALVDTTSSTAYQVALNYVGNNTTNTVAALEGTYYVPLTSGHTYQMYIGEANGSSMSDPARGAGGGTGSYSASISTAPAGSYTTQALTVATSECPY